MATFESMDRRMPKIEACLKANGLESLDACNEMLLAKGIDCDKIVRGVQPSALITLSGHTPWHRYRRQARPDRCCRVCCCHRRRSGSFHHPRLCR